MFYVVDEDISIGWVAVKTKPRDIFDDSNGETSENDVDTYCENEPFNVPVKDTLQEVAENLSWIRHNRDDICYFEFDEDVHLLN